MYARVTTVDGNPDAIERGIAFVMETVEPLIESLPGSLGLNMLVARDLGRVTVVSAWDTVEARAAAGRELSPVRDEAGRIMSGEARTTDLEWVVALRARPQQVGYWARTTRLTAPTDRVDTAIAEFVSGVLPAVRGMAGFCSAVLLVDRVRGAAVAATAWVDHEALEASRTRVAPLRDTTVQRSSAKVDEVFESELVIAGLHQELWQQIPQQADRTIELPSEQRV
jgi:hypothetical protein